MRRLNSISYLTILTFWALISLLPNPGFAQGSKDPARESFPVRGFLRDVIIFSQAQRVKVELAGEGLTGDFRSFTLNQPSRLVIDFPRVLSSFPKKFIDVEHPLLKDIRLGQQPDRLRFVLTFPVAELPPHRIIREADGITIIVGKTERDLEEEKKPEMEEKRGSEAPQAPAETLPPEKPEGEKLSPRIYTGEKITLDFSEADIRRVFALISEVARRPIVPGADVQGTVTLRLVDVPWDQALDAVLSIYDLKRVEEGTLIRILPRSP